jgi:hypothetical protein
MEGVAAGAAGCPVDDAGTSWRRGSDGLAAERPVVSAGSVSSGSILLGMRVDPRQYERLDLLAHSLLADVPLHDVWVVELPGGGSGRTVADLRAILSRENLTTVNAVVRLLFALRARLGGFFGWDHEPPQADQESVLHRLSKTDREASLVAPGTPEGPFRVVYVSPREAISEIQNVTVHAFSVFALTEHSLGYRLYWAVYVRPVGRITGWYMRLVDPFRRLVIYPAVLRQIRASWARDTRAAAG